MNFEIAPADSSIFVDSQNVQIGLRGNVFDRWATGFALESAQRLRVSLVVLVESVDAVGIYINEVSLGVRANFPYLGKNVATGIGSD